MRWPSLIPSLALACALSTTAARGDRAPTPEELRDLEAAPPESSRLQVEAVPAGLDAIDAWFEGNGTRRLHVQLDRPLYRPGDSVWIKTWNLGTRGLDGAAAGEGVVYELVDPRGSVVETKNVQQVDGTATNDVVVPADAPGGRWLLRATAESGEVDERPFVVASYQAPTIRKELDFVREAYGPGDRVEALVELLRPTGEPLAGHAVRALLQVDGETVHEATFETDATGAVLVSAELPRRLDSGDGLLTVLVDEGGVTESISRSVPIVLSDLRLSFFPEGGDLVSDLPGRVYFEGQDRHGEPADVEGVVEDDRGRTVAAFRSVHDGLGRFAFTPEPGRSYRARVTAPEGIDATFPLPDAVAEGCTLRAYDDVKSEVGAVRVGVRCSRRRDVVVVGAQREQRLDTAAVRAGPDRDAVVHLVAPKALADRQGAVRVTVFEPRELAPLAERLVYRNAGRDLRLELTPDRAVYGPRDEVVLKVRSFGPSGAPAPAEVALSVVDDTVVSLADDEEGNAMTRIYLEPELVEAPDDPAWYYDREEPLAARGLDLVLGTRGWRRFDWRPVFAPAPSDGEVAEAEPTAAPATRSAGIVELAAALEMAPPVDASGPPAPEEVLSRAEAEAPPPVAREAANRPQAVAGERRAFAAGAPAQRAEKKKVVEARDEDFDWPVEEAAALGYLGYDDQWVPEVAWAPVRVFPRPEHRPGFSGPRTDFRDTVHWEPTLHTDAEGRAELRFQLSDATTTFRVTAEGAGAGAVGHAEATVSSVLPVSVATKLPPAVSAGDRLVLPLTVTNTRGEPLTVAVGASFGSELLVAERTSERVHVGAKASATSFVPVTVGHGSETVRIRLTAEGSGLTDAVERELLVVPPGFPRAWSAAGELARSSEHHLVVDDPVPGSLVATVSWHPSTVATLMSGLDGLIGTPGGCFEQTSSTNWPNVAILNYLETHEGEPRLRARSGQALEVGYGILTGYQVDAGGFETWGDGPGKEALSAFGLLQFTDMAKVYPVSPAVLTRNADYLLSRRDGSGGFENSGESAHGYGSAPKPVLDGFVTWALVATGHTAGIQKEIAQQAKVARTTADPYVLALAARTLLVVGDPAAPAAVERLAGLQAPDGSFPGAESSITRSYESNLLVESTALATLALLEAEGRFAAADRGAAWLVEHRRGPGTWGATQATALALGALTAHADQARRPKAGGTLAVEVNGRPVGSLAYAPDASGPLVIDGLEEALRKGENTIVLRHPEGEPLPFTVDVRWTALTPATAPGAELALTTSLDRQRATMGETVRLTATIANRTDAVVPSPIARIGLPAGLEAQTWQLKELQERGVIAFFETRPREVTLYWDGVHHDDAHEVKLDLLAAVPGTFTGPASGAWPYYDDDEKAWAEGLRVEIATP